MAIDLGLTLSVAKDNWDDVEWWRNLAIPYAKRTLLSGVLKPYYSLTGPNPINIMDEDWDNLLILDACRFDMFEESCNLNGDLKKKISIGSSTPEFLQRTFKDETFHDTVYVTANPQVALRLDSGTFYETIDVWKTDWNEELGTVEPAPVTKAALKAQEEYPNKRLIVHYMQPHYPFIGEIGQEELTEHGGFELTKRLANGENAKREGETVWDMLKNGEVPEEIVWNAYIENLNIVLADIESALEEFNGKTVITSDHGNLMGETVTPLNIQLYGHPTGIHTKELITVPWFMTNGSKRKSVESDTPETERPTRRDKGAESEVIQERLKDLGYK